MFYKLYRKYFSFAIEQFGNEEKSCSVVKYTEH